MDEHKTVAELEAEIESQNEFISIIAHQMKTPLAGTKWVFKMMLDGDFLALKPEQRKIIEEGFRKNERMINLVNELRQAGKTRMWNFQYNREDMDFEALVRQMIEETLPLAKIRTLPILFEHSGQECKNIHADSGKITIALENLFDNAIKYAPEGSDINVELACTDTEATLSVHNDGSTINPGEEEKIFQKYERGSYAADSHVGGTGLGLFTVKRIIADHNGSVKFESNPDTGTTVSITLPFATS